MADIEYSAWVERITALAAAVRQLQPDAAAMGVMPEPARGWHGALLQKLLPQVTREPVLVVAVVGGTNTGKSTVFNYLVGSAVSRTSVYATYTRHPVCVAPQGALETLPLAEIFEGFRIRPWQSEADAVAEGPDNLLIVREDPSGQQAARLLLLDTPDMDGVLRDHWSKAEQIRNTADVLVCILTPEKYADHAILEFLKPAAQSDTTVIVVMNKLQQPEDRRHIPMWLEPLSGQADITPQEIYTIPLDRQAAEANRLRVQPYSSGAGELRDDLADLKFTALKLRSLRGSLRVVLDEDEGLPAFLRQLVACSEDYARDRDTLQQEVCTPQIQLPSLPPRLLWEPIWEWLEPHRTRFDRVIHGTYGYIGHLLLKPFRRSEEQLEESFRAQEWEAYHQAIQRILDQMRLLREVGSPRVQQAVQQALSGTQQEHLLTELRVQYDKLPVVSEGFRRYVGQLLDEFAQTSPYLMRGIKYGLVATAVLRPAVTIGLFAFPGAELSAHFAAQAALESAQRALDVAGTEAAKAAASQMLQEAAAQAAQHSIATVGVQAAVAVTAEGVTEGGGAATLRQLLARITQGYYQERATCLMAIVSQHVTGPMLNEIDHLARVSQCEPLQRAKRLLSELQTALIPNAE